MHNVTASSSNSASVIYESNLFTYLLCHSHCLSLTSKLRNEVYAIDFCMAFCRLFVMLINDNRIDGTICCEEAKIGN